jgi:hypothetical protein
VKLKIWARTDTGWQYMEFYMGDGDRAVISDRDGQTACFVLEAGRAVNSFDPSELPMVDNPSYKMLLSDN